jgi:hypothetical protein
MKSGTLTFLTTAILFSVLPIPMRLPAQNAGSTFITFDPPGADMTAGNGYGTFPKSINAAAAITGHYTDRRNVNHGFLRSPGGEFITFDAPDAVMTAGSGSGTFPSSINKAGSITGHYTDGNGFYHGFLRSPAGEFLTLNAPGTGTSVSFRFGAFPGSININNQGTIAGNYIDFNNISHGFLRSPGGEFTTLDAPGAKSVPDSFDGTLPKSINNGGAITGNYVDSNGLIHGFLRTSSGKLTTFDAPGASCVAASGFGTFPESINETGVITGHCTNAHNVTHGFVRDPSGKFTTFDAPGADMTAASGYGTFPESINDAGVITGHYTDAHYVIHGFLRSPSGKLTTFDAPGAGTIEGSGLGTFPDSINDGGVIAGRYTDAHNVNHGFVRIP